MRPRFKLLAALVVVGGAWLLVLLQLGLWHATWRPSVGVLPHTFNGWADYPADRHLFLAQFTADEFARGTAYTSHPYPILLFAFLFLAPFHFLLGLPYEVAHNFLVYLYVACLVLLLVLTRRDQLPAILERGGPFHWLSAAVSIGLLVTNPLPWLCLKYDRDNLYVLAAGAFCYLSAWVFRDETPKKPLLFVGIFLALWLPIYVPAWIMACLFFNRALALDRGWVLRVVGVTVLGGLNIMLPKLVCRLAGVRPTGSGFLYRSGLDGSTQYMTSIYQAVFMPADPRHWPFAFYFLAALLLGVALHYLIPGRKYHPFQQAFFLLIPYSVTIILFPQLTSIHPYLADSVLVVPAAFLTSFWSLQKEFWGELSGKTYAAWILFAGLILMTNLLVVAQNLRN